MASLLEGSSKLADGSRYADFRRFVGFGVREADATRDETLREDARCPALEAPKMASTALASRSIA